MLREAGHMGRRGMQPSCRPHAPPCTLHGPLMPSCSPHAPSAPAQATHTHTHLLAGMGPVRWLPYAMGAGMTRRRLSPTRMPSTPRSQPCRMRAIGSADICVSVCMCAGKQGHCRPCMAGGKPLA